MGTILPVCLRERELIDPRVLETCIVEGLKSSGRRVIEMLLFLPSISKKDNPKLLTCQNSHKCKHESEPVVKARRPSPFKPCAPKRQHRRLCNCEPLT